MKIIDSKLQGNVLQEFTDDYLEKHKELIKYVKEETKKQLILTDVSERKLPHWVRPLIAIVTMSLSTLFVIYRVFYVC